MRIRDVALTGPLRWWLERANDAGTLPLVVRALPATGLEVIRAVGGKEPSPRERRRISRLVQRHRTRPLQLPAEVGGIRDYVVEVATDGWTPPHRSARSSVGYASPEEAETRIAQMREIYCRRAQPPPRMKVVARPLMYPKGYKQTAPNLDSL